MAKLIAWRLIGPDASPDVFTVSDFTAAHWLEGDGFKHQPWTLEQALLWLNRDAGDGYSVECRVIAWPQSAVI